MTQLPMPDASLSKEEKNKQLMNLAQAADSAERHEDVCFYLQKLVVEQDGKLDDEQRNLFSVGFKNVVGTLRSAWRQLREHEYATAEDASITKQVLDKYLNIIKNQVLAKCQEVVGLLQDSEGGIKIPSGDEESHVEEAVFYLKMKGDYYRYMAEVDKTFKDASGKTFGDQAAEAYEEAQEKAEKLNATHPTRLGLALNQSVCYFEIKGDNNKACECAKKAFDQAIQKLDTLNDETYKDSTLIMQLLRDNLTLWTQDEKNPNNVEEQED